MFIGIVHFPFRIIIFYLCPQDFKWKDFWYSEKIFHIYDSGIPTIIPNLTLFFLGIFYHI